MVLRKGNERLHRLCKKCGKEFEPIGKFQKLCENCKPESIQMKLWKKTQRKKNKEKKYE